jgi:hypothetical protein
MEKLFAMFAAAQLTCASMAGTRPAPGSTGAVSDQDWNNKVWATFRTFYGDARNGVIGALSDDTDWAKPPASSSSLNADVAAVLQSIVSSLVPAAAPPAPGGAAGGGSPVPAKLKA